MAVPSLNLSPSFSVKVQDLASALGCQLAAISPTTFSLGSSVTRPVKTILMGVIEVWVVAIAGSKVLISAIPTIGQLKICLSAAAFWLGAGVFPPEPGGVFPQEARTITSAMKKVMA